MEEVIGFWHTPKDNPPQDGKKILFLWGQGENIKDLNQSMGCVATSLLNEKIIRGDDYTRWAFTQVKLWAYVDDLLPQSI